MSRRSAQRALVRQAEPMKTVERLLRENAYRHSLHEVFRDFCAMSAIAISNSVDMVRREKREARYMQIVKRYSREELSRFAQMLAELACALGDELHDAMGRLFMALELGNHWVGQFFTPYEVALTMAKMQFHDARELVERRGFVTVSDPACGAGCTLIAAAQALHDEGFNYQQAMHVTAQDLDETAAQMAYLQLSLLHIPAVVVVGDTLRMEERDRWYTPAHVLGLWDVRLRRSKNTARPATAVPAAQPSVTNQLGLFGGAT